MFDTMAAVEEIVSRSALPSVRAWSTPPSQSTPATPATPATVRGRTLLGTGALPVGAPLGDLFPDHQLRRGSVLGLTGRGGSVSLLLALVSGAMATGSWAAVVAVPTLGVEAAADLGAPLDHLALVPEPGDRWPEVVGALLDAMDLVAVAPPGRCRPADGRRLAARARERRSVLVVVEPAAPGPAKPASAWPEPVDLHLEVTSATWDGLDGGDGALRRRHVTVRSSGRRSASRQRAVALWLPAADGRLQVADTLPELVPRNPLQPKATPHAQPGDTLQGAARPGVAGAGRRQLLER